jgi:hypothetical protein
MTNPRRTLAVVASLTVGALVATAAPLSASARTLDPSAHRSADPRCAGHGPIAASTLVRGTAAPACSLVGRVVTTGRVAVVVPRAGMTVAGEGSGSHGEAPSLQVTNTGTTVRAVVGDAAGSTTGQAVSSARATDPPACQDRTFHLEHHRWSGGLRYQINLGHMPKRYGKQGVIRQIKVGNGNMRKGRNSCGKPRLKTPGAHYLGRTSVRPDINPGAKAVTCGRGNLKNVVGFGNLPGGLLGWTCFWIYNDSGRMAAADIMIDTGKRLRTHLPRHCTDSYDFEGVLTHEWGHAYGMGHTGSGHANLTMQHQSHPCSTFARTLGLGDWLGMKKMYGAR